MNKPVYLGLSKVELSKIVMYEFLYNYVKPKYGENAKFSYMDTDCFIVYIKTESISADIAKDVEARLKKIVGSMKEGFGGKNNERICCIESQNIPLFNRQQW